MSRSFVAGAPQEGSIPSPDRLTAHSNEPYIRVMTDALRDRLAAALGHTYELQRLLGKGGMGSVYLARETALDRLVAVKVLRPEVMGEPETRERFRREARTAAKLTHPHIVPLHTFGEADGLLWFVMGYVAGETLARSTGRDLDQLLAAEILAPLGLTDHDLFYPVALSGERMAEVQRRVAPTERDDWRGRLVRGEVHDENCHALGGVSGHAGLFGTARAVDAMRLADSLDHIVLFSGDGDFRSLVAALQQKGKRVSVISTLQTQPD